MKEALERGGHCDVRGKEAESESRQGKETGPPGRFHLSLLTKGPGFRKPMWRGEGMPRVREKWPIRDVESVRDFRGP